MKHQNTYNQLELFYDHAAMFTRQKAIKRVKQPRQTFKSRLARAKKDYLNR